MKLYEINYEIMRLADAIEVDEETGELLGDADVLLDEIRALEMEKKSILTWLAKLVLNLRAEQAALKSEEERLKARRERLAKKEERLLYVIDRECAGETTDLGIATFTYRQTSRVEITDPEKTARWLKRNKYTDAYENQAPKLFKPEIRKLINAGKKVPGSSIVEDVSKKLK